MFSQLVKSATLLLVLASAVFAAKVQIDVTKEVTCKHKSKFGDTVSVHYEGFLMDGTPFDSSYDRGTPITFQLGAGRVIQGWEQGIKDMCIGEKRKLTIPSSLGYGSRGVGPIPANSDLLFNVELVDISGVPKDEL